MPRSTLELAAAAGRAVACVYVPVLAVVAAVRAITGLDLAHQWACSPRLLAEGKVWTLFSSALVLDQVQALQLVAIALLTAVLIRRHGPGAWWTALLLGHVGSTLAAYAGTGILWETGAAFGPAEVTPDFGVSCVWMTIVGLLVCDTLLTSARSETAWTVALAVAVVALAVTVGLGTSIFGVEHALAALAGFGTVVWKRRPVFHRESAPQTGPPQQFAAA